MAISNIKNMDNNKLEQSKPIIKELVDGAYAKEIAEKYDEAQKRIFGANEKKVEVEDISSEAIEEFLQGNKKEGSGIIVDIGSGARADYLSKWKKAANARLVIGIEPSEYMRQIAQRNIHDDALVLRDGSWLETGLENNCTDSVVSRFSFHHVRDIDKAYAEVARILRVGGKAIFAVPHPEYCERELLKQGLEIKNRKSMSVNVMGVPITYYYHSLNDYLNNQELEKNFKLLNVKVGDWVTGQWNVLKGEVPSLLVFEIERIKK